MPSCYLSELLVPPRLSELRDPVFRIYITNKSLIRLTQRPLRKLRKKLKQLLPRLPNLRKKLRN